jgi:hypothetical protein
MAPPNQPPGGPPGVSYRPKEAGNEPGSGTDPTAPTPTSPTSPTPGLPAGGLQIPLAKPYDFSNFTQQYGNHLPPYMNLQQQIEQSMMGIPAAKPGFNWANMGPTGWGGPGWAGMLGYAPPGGRNGNA